MALYVDRGLSVHVCQTSGHVRSYGSSEVGNRVRSDGDARILRPEDQDCHALVGAHPLHQSPWSTCHSIRLFIDTSHIDSKHLDPLRKWSQFSRKTVEEFVRFNPVTEPAKGHFDILSLAPVYEVERTIGLDISEPYHDTKFEQDVYSSTTAVFPPGSLLYRHLALSQCVRSKTNRTTLEKVKEEVLRTWELNPVLFQTNNKCRWDQPYPSIVHNPHNGIERFFELNVQYDSLQVIPVRDFIMHRTIIPIIKTFFALAIKALQKVKNHIGIEVVHDEAVTGLPRLFLNSGPPHIPSNIQECG
ncbi:hypothetical protein FA15DRAFT_711446 [Coprinopsis marcescibilis]|uniref:Uncharacterized protein n=1 Tax=Coprinopsis marcescibilis TaxID=230819 RepID=A0A5C3K9M1_COPMA|nr:hypothetical protein FA15DRAFT_711446 [Coprinopsis marcescibilis]